MKKFFPIAFAAALAMTLTAFAGPSSAAYPVNTCVAKKMGAAGKFCSAVLGAWSKNADDSGARDAAITKAATKLDGKWTKSEASAAKKNVDCADTTASSADIRVSIETAAAALAATVLDGTTSDKFDTGCRAKINKAAAKLCQGLLKAEGKYIKDLLKDKDGTTLAAAVAKVEGKFTKLYDKSVAKALGKGVTCPSTTDGTAIQTEASALSDEVVTDTTVSPNVSTDWTTISVPVANVEYPAKYPKAITTLFPTCSRLTPYRYYAKRGTTNNLLVYYFGGGACWDNLSCNVAQTFAQAINESYDPATGDSGFTDFSDPSNPFADWNVVLIPYCTGDIHWGDAFGGYGGGGGVYHHGRHNASLVEKYAREHFVNPDRVFVTGSSAGAYGALLNSVPLMEFVYPASRFDVLADAGVGVADLTWQATYFPNWGVAKTVPDYVPGLDGSVESLLMSDIWASIANHYPDNRFGQYSTAYDYIQAQFFRAMGNPGNPLTWTAWWDTACDWNAEAMTVLGDTEVAVTGDNFRYYVGAGTQHTIWFFDKIFHDTHGGVPTLATWIGDMLDDDPAWANETCTDCNMISVCSGGDNSGQACSSDLDCPGGGTCSADPAPAGVESAFPGYPVVDCPAP